MAGSMFERYTERARRVIFFSRYEASQFGSRTIEVGHLLLGVVREDKTLVRQFLPALQVDQIRKAVEERMPRAADKVATSIDLPLSSECKRALAYAAEEVERLSHEWIGTGHILLGLLRDDHAASSILRERGLTLETAREELAGSGVEEPHAPVPPASPVGYSWVRDAETAVKIAEAVLVTVVGPEEVEKARPYEAFAAGHQWVVRGSVYSGSTDRLTALIERSGRIVFAGKGSG